MDNEPVIDFDEALGRTMGDLDFLKMIQRKCQWIDKNRRKLAEAIGT